MRLICLAAATLACLAVGAAPAAAKRNPYKAKEVCGGGFTQIDHHRLRDGGRVLARVVLMYHPDGRNCTVTLKRAKVGRKTYVAASLGAINRPFWTDQGLFRYYAGPIYAYAPGTCVKWSGAARPGGGRDSSYVSPYEHCG